MKIRDMVSFRGLRDDIDEMSRNKNRNKEQQSNPIAIAKTCIVATVVSLPACILSFISREFFMGIVFLLFAIMGIVLATMLNVKATQVEVGTAQNSVIENFEKESNEPRLSTREKMRLRKEQAQLNDEETIDIESENISDK